MDIIATMDGDRQMDPLPSRLDPIVDCKVRLHLGNRLSSPNYLPRSYDYVAVLWKCDSHFSHKSYQAIGLTDPQNSYTAISRRALEVIGFEGMYPRYGYLNDRLVRLNIRGLDTKHPHLKTQ